MLLLGGQYAEHLGVNTVALRNKLLFVTGLLTASATAFCGPIAFIGLAVPHIARMIINTDDHRQLLPATITAGILVALLCNAICLLPGESGIIPLNAITPIMGAPVIIYVITRRRRYPIVYPLITPAHGAFCTWFAKGGILHDKRPPFRM